MHVKRADILGFCFGVRRAVDLTRNAINENPEKKIYSLGPVIHNETVLAELESKGLKVISEKEIDDLDEDSVVIIRAHGVSPDILLKLNEKKCILIDATCPKVKGSQNLVKKYSAEFDYIAFTGDINHGEVKSIEGYGGDNFVLIKNYEDSIEFCKINNNASVLLLSQTTFSEEEFNKISTALKNSFMRLEIKNTICTATTERQSALIALCKEVDAILVIGGKKSANTMRLYNIARNYCKKAAFIQSADDIPLDFYNEKCVGITAGASTPDEIIDCVEKKLLGEK